MNLDHILPEFHDDPNDLLTAVQRNRMRAQASIPRTSSSKTTRKKKIDPAVALIEQMVAKLERGEEI